MMLPRTLAATAPSPQLVPSPDAGRPRVKATRGRVDDRFPSLSLVIQTAGKPYFEVLLATNAALLDPANEEGRTEKNSFSSRRVSGLLRADGGEALYVVPSAALMALRSATEVFYTVVAYDDESGAGATRAHPDVAEAPSVQFAPDFRGHTLSAILSIPLDRLRRVDGNGGVRAYSPPRPALEPAVDEETDDGEGEDGSVLAESAAASGAMHRAYRGGTVFKSSLKDFVKSLKPVQSSSASGGKVRGKLTKGQLEQIFPRLFAASRGNKALEEKVTKRQKHLNEAFDLMGIDTVESQALYLAHAEGESGSLVRFTESQQNDFGDTDPKLDTAYLEKTFGPGTTHHRRIKPLPDLTWNESFIGRGALQVTLRLGYLQAIATLMKRAEQWENGQLSDDPYEGVEAAGRLRETIDAVLANPFNGGLPEHAFLLSAGHAKNPRLSFDRAALQTAKAGSAESFTRGVASSWMRGGASDPLGKQKYAAYRRAVEALSETAKTQSYEDYDGRNGYGATPVDDDYDDGYGDPEEQSYESSAYAHPESEDEMEFYGEGLGDEDGLDADSAEESEYDEPSPHANPAGFTAGTYSGDDYDDDYDDEYDGGQTETAAFGGDYPAGAVAPEMLEDEDGYGERSVEDNEDDEQVDAEAYGDEDAEYEDEALAFESLDAPTPSSNGVSRGVAPKAAQPLTIDAQKSIIRAVAQIESGEDFAAVKANEGYSTKGHPAYQRYLTGLSYGYVGFNQDSGDLGKLLAMQRERDKTAFDSTYGSDAATLIAVTNAAGPPSKDSPKGRSARVQPVAGKDLWEEPWLARFRKAAKHVPFQAAQLEMASKAFLEPMLPMARSLRLTTDRALAILMDRAVEMGVADAQQWVAAAVSPAQTPAQRQQALAALGYNDVASFQHDAGLVADGRWTAQTQAAVTEALIDDDTNSPLPVASPNQMLDAIVRAAAREPFAARVAALRNSDAFQDVVYEI